MIGPSIDRNAMEALVFELQAQNPEIQVNFLIYDYANADQKFLIESFRSQLDELDIEISLLVNNATYTVPVT